MKTIQKKRRGFTLAELVVVVTILGILMLIAVSRFSSITDSANERAFQANHKIAVSAITMYMADNSGAKPADATKLDNYIASPSDSTKKGLAALTDNPKGSTYEWDGTKLTSTYNSKTLEYTP
ncbi:MAG: type II secretion system protein [Filifactor alocis]|nr:type II secretion system protein [Filifactor alocis]